MEGLSLVETKHSTSMYLGVAEKAEAAASRVESGLLGEISSHVKSCADRAVA